MKHTLIATALCGLLFATTACKRDAAAPPEPAAPAADATAADDGYATDVISEVDNAPAPEGIDARSFAGSFKGTMPCADCSGIDTALDLKADGTYALSETYQEKKDGQTGSDGTWTAEENGKRLRLDPNSKDEDDRLYGVVSKNELQLLDRDGNAPQGGLDYNLKRAVAGK